MSLAPTEEQQELRAVVRGFMEAKSGEEAVRKQMEDETGFDASVWTQLAEQVGALGLAVPEDLGGAGYGLRELGILFEEAGRVLYTGPLLGTFMATQAVLAGGDPDVQAELVPDLASGRTGAFGWLDDTGRRACELSRDGDTITGSVSFVIDGGACDVLVVVNGAADDDSAYVIDASGPGVERTALETLDQTRRQARIDLTSAPARRLPVTGSTVLSNVLDRASVLVAAEQVGAAERTLELAVEYAKIREQFGRPIGSFQAIKHKCADMFVQVEAARSAALYGLHTADENPDDLPMAASMAKAFCSEAFTFVATENIQVFGGVGFTWEHPAHLYFKRAKSMELLLGSPSSHYERIAQMVGM